MIPSTLIVNRVAGGGIEAVSRVAISKFDGGGFS